MDRHFSYFVGVSAPFSWWSGAAMGRKGGKSLNPADQLRTLQGMERA